jgi:hypothetical protein
MIQVVIRDERDNLEAKIAAAEGWRRKCRDSEKCRNSRLATIHSSTIAE